MTGASGWRACKTAHPHKSQAEQDSLSHIAEESQNPIRAVSRSGIARKLRALAKAVEGGNNGQTACSDDLELFHRVCRIAHDWTRSPEYTGRDGEPKALPFRGRNGLVALISSLLLKRI
jgi:hypothetical protein